MNQTTALPELFAALCSEGSFQKMIFSDKRRKSIAYQKVTLRPILVGGQPCCQATYTYPKKVTHRNLPFAETAAFCMTLCEEDFKQINIFTQTEQLQVLAARPDRPSIRRKSVEAGSKRRPDSRRRHAHRQCFHNVHLLPTRLCLLCFRTTAKSTI